MDDKQTVKMWRSSFELLLRALSHPATRIAPEFWDWDYKTDLEKRFVTDDKGNKIKTFFITENNVANRLKKVVGEMAAQLDMQTTHKARTSSDNSVKRTMDRQKKKTEKEKCQKMNTSEIATKIEECVSELDADSLTDLHNYLFPSVKIDKKLVVIDD